MRTIGLGVIATLSLLLTGCAGKHAFHNGLDAEIDGRDWIAAQEYAESLARLPRNDKRRRALDRVAHSGFYKGLEKAERLERRGEFEDARRLYEDLDRFVALLDDHDLRDFDVPDLDDRIEAQWGQLAALSEDSGDWRTAIRRHQRADNPERAAVIHSALGEWFAAGGRCRAAVEEYEAAIRLSPSNDRRDAKDDAVDCATVHLVVERFTDRTHGDLDGLNAGRLLRDAVLDRLDGELSRYVHVVDARFADEPGDYVARVELLDADVDAWQDIDLRAGNGTVSRPCDDEICERPVRVTWTEFSHELRAEISGAVTVVGADGESFSRSFRDDVRQETRWAVDVSAPDGSTLPSELDNLVRVDRTAPHPRDAAYAVIDEAADEIADFVKDKVDRERDPADPRHLDLESAI